MAAELFFHQSWQVEEEPAVGGLFHIQNDALRCPLAKTQAQIGALVFIQDDPALEEEHILAGHACYRLPKS